jgi:hypothetical protein
MTNHSIPAAGHSTHLPISFKPRVHWLVLGAALFGGLGAHWVGVGPTAAGTGCTPYERAQVARAVERTLTLEQAVCCVAERAAPSSAVAADCGVSEPVVRLLQGALSAAERGPAVRPDAAGDASRGD